MQYIDKTNKDYSTRGHQIVETFIKGQWQDEAQRYVNLDYKSFRIDELVALTMEEQGGFCCYCMRELHNELNSRNVTLEHVIPNKTKEEADYNHYIQYGALDAEHVIFGDLIDRSKQLKLPPYPHFVAYENLVASCNGELIEDAAAVITLCHCCNNRRKSDQIVPLFFLPNVAEIISYAPDGSLVYDSIYEKTVHDVLNLDHKTLVLFRRGWHRICKLYSVEDVKRGLDDNELRFDIILDSELPVTDQETLLNRNYWKLFCEFSWFHIYYNNSG